MLEWIFANISKKVSYEATRRFQETWVIKLTWVECVKACDSLYDFVKCIVCRYLQTHSAHDSFMLINIGLFAYGFGVGCKLRIAFVVVYIYFAFIIEFYFDTYIDL